MEFEKWRVIRASVGGVGGLSSNMNEVIRAVLNFLLFFYEKISHAQKSTKKHKKAPTNTKSTKAQKHDQIKAQKRK